MGGGGAWYIKGVPVRPVAVVGASEIDRLQSVYIAL